MTILNIEENSFVQNRKLEVNLRMSRSREIPVLFYNARKEQCTLARMVNIPMIMCALLYAYAIMVLDINSFSNDPWSAVTRDLAIYSHWLCIYDLA